MHESQQVDSFFHLNWLNCCRDHVLPIPLQHGNQEPISISGTNRNFYAWLPKRHLHLVLPERGVTVFNSLVFCMVLHPQMQVLWMLHSVLHLERSTYCRLFSGIFSGIFRYCSLIWAIENEWSVDKSAIMGVAEVFSCVSME